MSGQLFLNVVLGHIIIKTVHSVYVRPQLLLVYSAYIPTLNVIENRVTMLLNPGLFMFLSPDLRSICY